MLKASLKNFIVDRFPPLYRLISSFGQEVRRFIKWRRAGLSVRSELAGYRSLRIARQFRPLPRNRQNIQAFLHVGTEPKEGIAQLAALIHHGCRPHHGVLEIGCGTLNAGYPLMQYLESGNYCGIEPERWAIEQSLTIGAVARMAKEKNARFEYNLDFDGSPFGKSFDFVLSHSILSHAAHWQLPLFLKNLAHVTKPGAKVLASLHFTDGNSFGGPSYAGTELDFKEWVYPGNSFFRKDTIVRVSHEHGFTASIDVTIPFLITDAHSAAVHSWVVFTKT